MHAKTLAARAISCIGVLALALLLASCQGRGAKSTTYTVGGTAPNVAGTGLMLQNNGGNNLALPAGGAFTFSNALTSGATYRVTVLTQPSGQTCAVENGTGTVSTNVTNVAVNCASNASTVGGAVSGLTGTGLVLQNRGSNDLPISADGPFTFSTALASGVAYSVTVLAQPSGQGCAVANGSGSIAGANVTNVTVTCAAAPAAPTLSLLGFGVKELKFSWAAVSGATFYRLLENPDGSGYAQVATNITTSSFNYTIPVHRRLNAQYKVQACNVGGCSGDSNEQTLGINLAQAIGYVKASNTGAGDTFGFSVALSGDGNALAVGAPLEDRGGTGIDSTSVELADDAGAVYFYTRSANTWSQKAYVKASNLNISNTGAVDKFGTSVALNSDGNTLAVGAPFEDGSSTGVSGAPNDLATNTGAAYLY